MHKTDWFCNKKWGLFVHYLNSVQNNPKHVTNMNADRQEWSTCVDALDVELLAKQVHEVNAGYLFFTMLQRSKHLIAPNETYNKITGYGPGEACSKRDLVFDLYNALSKYGIDLFLYYTGDGPLDDPISGPAMGYVNQKDKVSLEFVTKWASVAEEYSKRYGKKIKAWWVDGCYAYIGYDEEKLTVLASAIKSGNPDALVSLNKGVEKRVSSYSINDDFTTGEMNSFEDIPDSRFVGGSQWHTLSFLGIPPKEQPNAGWASTGSKYSGEYMHDYIQRVNKNGGVVTVNVTLFRDGHIDPEQMEVLSHLKDLR